MSAAEPPAVDAYTIFLRSRAAVTAASYPPALAYTIAVSGDAGRGLQVNRYRAFCVGGDKLFVDPISAKEAAKPVTPHGVNFRISFQLSWNAGAGGKTETISRAAGRPEGSPDLIGVPDLSPTYMFGMRYESLASPEAVASPSSLRTIAVVAVGKPAYSVTLSGVVVVDGTKTYQLGLVPLRDPKKNRLRALWVGANDYLPRKAVVAGNFTIAPFEDVPWTIRFGVANGAPLIADEKADETLFMPHRHVVRDVSIAFENVHTSDDTLANRGAVLPLTPTSMTLVEP